MTMHPATVLGTSSPYVDVRLDGDVEGGYVRVTNIVGGALVPNDRVMVMLVPPMGGYVLGRVGGGMAVAAQIMNCPDKPNSGGESSQLTMRQIVHCSPEIDATGSRIYVTRPGIWAVSATVLWTPPESDIGAEHYVTTTIKELVSGRTETTFRDVFDVTTQMHDVGRQWSMANNAVYVQDTAEWAIIWDSAMAAASVIFSSLEAHYVGPADWAYNKCTGGPS